MIASGEGCDRSRTLPGRTARRRSGSSMSPDLRVTSKSRDDLQEVQRLLKGADLDVALQFTNYR